MKMDGIESSHITDTGIKFNVDKLLSLYKTVENTSDCFLTPIQCSAGHQNSLNFGTKNFGKVSDKDCTHLLSHFTGTYIEEVIHQVNTIFSDFFACRARFITLKSVDDLSGPSARSFHIDQQKNRLLIPIIDNEYSYLIMDNKLNKLELGKMYLLDTSVLHSPVNLHKTKERVNLGITLWSR